MEPSKTFPRLMNGGLHLLEGGLAKKSQPISELLEESVGGIADSKKGICAGND